MPEDVETYRLLQPLGRGARSRVHRARAATGEEVALRVLGLGADDSARERFRIRARRAVEGRVPHVVKGLDAGCAEDRSPWLASRLVTGRTLAQLLAYEARPDRAVVLAVLERVATAIDALHALGLAHGDVKPASVLVSLARGRLEVALADAGDVDDPGAIRADLEALGRMTVRGLAHELGAADRRRIGEGRDPDSGRPARSARALIEASRRATALVPGPVRTVAGFWDTPAAEPGSGARRRWRVGLLVVALLLAAGLVADRIGGSPSPDVAPSPPEDAATRAMPARSELLGLAPAAFRATCEVVGARSSSIGSVTCRDGAVDVRYTLFADDAELRTAYRRDAPPGLGGPTSPNGPPTCADGAVEERAWTTARHDHQGRYRCELDSTGASITWTTEAVTGGGVLAHAGVSTADLGALFRWWRDEAGPTGPA